MLQSLPSTDPDSLIRLTWADIEPACRDLEQRTLSADTVDSFLHDWSTLATMVSESYSRLYAVTTANTADEEAMRLHDQFLETVYPAAKQVEQTLQTMLLESGLAPAGFEEPLRKIRAEAELFREENLPLLTEERRLTTDYNVIRGGQTVEWDGEELPASRVLVFLQEPDRPLRERAWRAVQSRHLKDREAINDLWRKLLAVRLGLAANADLPDYRTYRWRQMLRLDYTPEDCRTFQRSIEEVVVPVARRRVQRRQEQLGVPTLRPWDLGVDPLGRPRLRPFEQVEELVSGVSRIVRRLDGELGDWIDLMAREGLLDLDSRANKAPGGYCTGFTLSKRPFIFMNAAGIHRDVETLLHEAGHAFHDFESWQLPYAQQWQVGLEFAEVASTSMEFLGGPYLASEAGGFYNGSDAARARLDHLDRTLQIWSQVGAIDTFQHWIYEHPDEAADPARCEEKWAELYTRFFPGIDWTDLEDELETGWHNILHIHEVPFYYVEYGLAALGAVQIWAASLQNQSEAVKRYRQALALGGTRPLPELYAAAGAKFAFDAETLRSAVALIEQTIGELETVEGDSSTQKH